MTRSAWKKIWPFLQRLLGAKRIKRKIEAQIRKLRHTMDARHNGHHATFKKMLEVRTQLAADEAKGYADHGLGSLSRSLGAASRAAVKTAKRVDEVESRLESLTHDTLATRAGFETRIESIGLELNRIVSDYNTQLRNAEHRIEFIRSEAMYEMQVSSYHLGGRSPPSRTVPRLINAAKVDAMRAGGLRLNVGCGHIQLDDYINVDRRALPGIDIVADANDIPFEENELTEIRSSHLVEHFTSHILERVLLPHWSALLKPGGILTTIAPDGAAMLEAVTSGEIEFEDFREVLFGAQDYDGDFHYNMLTPTTFSKALKTAGFKNITEEYVGKRNGKCFEFKIIAEKA